MSMIISRTPYRVSFFGGGTDYHPWYQEHGGAVLSTSINKYCYIQCRPLPPFFEHKSRVVWSQIELVNDHDEIVHPVIRAALDEYGINSGVEIHHHGDLPARSGLGSSSAFTVGMLHVLQAMKGRMMSKRQLATGAIYLEREVLDENVGIQDQIACAHGGFNRVDIDTDGSYTLKPVLMSGDQRQRFQDHLMLFFTGISRMSSEIAGEQIASIQQKQDTLARMQELVDEAESSLMHNDDVEKFGKLLHETWMLKRSLSSRVSHDCIDHMYEHARRAGALGGKVLGAGGGGFMLFFVPPERHENVRHALDPYTYVPVKFDTGGSELVYYEPED